MPANEDKIAGTKEASPLTALFHFLTEAHERAVGAGMGKTRHASATAAAPATTATKTASVKSVTPPDLDRKADETKLSGLVADVSSLFNGALKYQPVEHTFIEELGR